MNYIRLLAVIVIQYRQKNEVVNQKICTKKQLKNLRHTSAK